MGLEIGFSEYNDSSFISYCQILGMKETYGKETYGTKGEVLNLLRNYLHERYQSAVLHGQTSSRELIKSGVPQGSVLGPLMFLIYINDLPDNIQSTCKIFVDDTSLFWNVSDKSISQSEPNKDL